MIPRCTLAKLRTIKLPDVTIFLEIGDWTHCAVVGQLVCISSNIMGNTLNHALKILRQNTRFWLRRLSRYQKPEYYMNEKRLLIRGFESRTRHGCKFLCPIREGIILIRCPSIQNWKKKWLHFSGSILKQYRAKNIWIRLNQYFLQTRII